MSIATSVLRTTPIDVFPSPTSIAQAETESVLLKHIPGIDKDANPPTLAKNAHMQFLVRNLVQGFPARYMSQDASQPWLLFWTVQAFSILQVSLDPGNKQRVIDKMIACQHSGGGFGGGPGQFAHLLSTYAAVCTLAIVGRPGAGGGWDQIDRPGLYKFFMSLKQPDGSFLVAHHAEVDVRGIYCLLVVATLLDLLTPELVRGTAAFVASCQTYEGGFASASQPYFTPDDKLLPFPRPPLGEAHGGYTFCALAAWVLLQPTIEAGAEPALSVDISRLLRWLVGMQGGASELGGFKGRTNKLVDGCYAWWCGGAFGLLDSLGVGAHGAGAADVTGADTDTTAGWTDVDDSLFNREALQEYILYAGQHPAGGLRDKPPKNADAYHTLYCLAGLSAAQHRVVPSAARLTAIIDAWTPSETIHNPGGSGVDTLRKRVFSAALSWTQEEGASRVLGEASNSINATHPLFNLTSTHTEVAMAHFYAQALPLRAHRV